MARAYGRLRVLTPTMCVWRPCPPHPCLCPRQELLILREFVEHLQQARTGASTNEIDDHTASWVVDDVSKFPEELRSCCVCLEEVCCGSQVRTPPLWTPPYGPPLWSPPSDPPCCGSQVRTLPCLHTFHADCAEEWLRKKKVCPLCQFAIDGTNDSGTGEAH